MIRIAKSTVLSSNCLAYSFLSILSILYIYMSVFYLTQTHPKLFIKFFNVGDVGNVGNSFAEVASSAKIAFKHTDGDSGQKYFVEPLGAGAAFFDYDNDGDLDLYFVNGNTLKDNINVDDVGNVGNFSVGNSLYRNNGDETFAETTDGAMVKGNGYGFGCCVGDYDNDGFEDLYVTNFKANVLYHNNGDGTFSNVGSNSKTDDSKWGTSCAFGDYDGDGDLDLFVANYVKFDPLNNPICSRKGRRMYCGPENFEGEFDTLYQNNGDGTFSDVSQTSGIYNDGNPGKGLGVVWGDYDNDGDLDLFVANDTTPNMLYKNDGNGAFSEVALFSGVALSEDGLAFNGMGTNMGDYDNDGNLDLIVTNFQDQPNSLKRNQGNGYFTDESFSCGIGEKTLTYMGWGVDFFDYDNDGYLDLFVANGHIDENINQLDPIAKYAQLNQLFKNRGDGIFVEATSNSGLGLQISKVSRGAAFGDYDNDGDLDVLITNLNDTPDLLRNDSGNGNHWLIIKVVGTKGSRNGIGARITIKEQKQKQIREIKSGSSYLSQSDMRAHFGLGKLNEIEQIEIRWPDGSKQSLKNVKANQFLTIIER